MPAGMILIFFSIAGYIKYAGKDINPLAFNLIVAFSAAGIILTEFHRLSNSYEINNSSLVHIKGIFFRTTRRTDLLAVSDAELKQNPWQLVLGIGDVRASAFSEITLLKNINKYFYFRIYIFSKIQLFFWNRNFLRILQCFLTYSNYTEPP